MIEGHGDDLYRFGGKIRYNFSSNIIQNVDHSGLMKHLADNSCMLTSYPEPAPFTLESALAARHGVTPDCVMVTNGATEAIYLAAHYLSGKKSTILKPTFSEYQDACEIYGHSISHFTDIDDMPVDAEAVWVCNPNNPTGHSIEAERILKASDSKPGTCFVIDQAYCRYTASTAISAAEATSRDNLILLFSMTKDYSVPGLRLGYAIASERTIQNIKRLKMPWSVNAPALNAAYYLLDHSDLYKIPLDCLLKETRRVMQALIEIGIEVYPTDTNFMLCRMPHGSAAELKAYLAEYKGILIRDASNFTGLTPSHFRVAVQTFEMNNLLIDSIRQWMQSCL